MPSRTHLGPTWAQLGRILDPPTSQKPSFSYVCLNVFGISLICVLKRPSEPQDGPGTAPRAPKTAPRAPQSAPRASKRRPMDAQESPRAAQGGPKTAPRRSQVASNLLLIRIQKPSYDKTPPRGAQEDPKGPKRPPRGPREAPKRLPRGTKRLPRGSQEAPKHRFQVALSSISICSSDRRMHETGGGGDSPQAF